MLKKFANIISNYLYNKKLYKLIISVYEESDFNECGIAYAADHIFSVRSNLLPDLWFESPFQRKLLILFDDEKNQTDYAFKYGVLDVKKATFEMPDGVVRVKTGVVKRIMGDTDWALNFPKFYRSFFRTFSFYKSGIKKSVFISLPFNENYYHWLIETLPRLALFDLLNIKINGIKIIMPHLDGRPKFVWETLALTGFVDQIQHLNSGVYEADNLIIPTLTAPRSRIHPFAADWLRNKILLSNMPPEVFQFETKEYERIYIARDDAPSRRVANSTEVDKLLESFGFKKMTMTGKTVVEQARIFSAAKIIVGIHGAALANVLFCQKGATLIEIFMDGWFTKAFFNLARDRDMIYGCFLAKNLNDNLLVNIEELNILIKNSVNE